MKPNWQLHGPMPRPALRTAHQTPFRGALLDRDQKFKKVLTRAGMSLGNKAANCPGQKAGVGEGLKGAPALQEVGVRTGRPSWPADSPLS